MRVEYHPAARAEFTRVARRYEYEREGLGLAFLAGVRLAEAVIAAHPESGASLANHRRYLVPRFPYGIVYRAEDDRIFIIGDRSYATSAWLLGQPSLSGVRPYRAHAV